MHGHVFFKVSLGTESFGACTALEGQLSSRGGHVNQLMLLQSVCPLESLPTRITQVWSFLGAVNVACVAVQVHAVTK